MSRNMLASSLNAVCMSAGMLAVGNVVDPAGGTPDGVASRVGGWKVDGWGSGRSFFFLDCFNISPSERSDACFDGISFARYSANGSVDGGGGKVGGDGGGEGGDGEGGGDGERD